MYKYLSKEEREFRGKKVFFYHDENEFWFGNEAIKPKFKNKIKSLLENEDDGDFTYLLKRKVIKEIQKRGINPKYMNVEKNNGNIVLTQTFELTYPNPKDDLNGCWEKVNVISIKI